MATASINFTGIANGEVLGGAALPDWTRTRGVANIYTANEAIRTDTAGALTLYTYDALTPTNDAFIEADVATVSSGATSLGLGLNLQANGDGMFTWQNGTDIKVYRYSGGITEVASATLSPWASLQRIKFRYVSATNSYTVLDGSDSVLLSFVDATFSSGKCGVSAYYSTTSDAVTLDNIELGDYVIVGLQLDNSPSDITADVPTSVQVSNAATVPVFGNVEVKFVDDTGAAAVIDSITGTDPYTINFTFTKSTTAQFNSTGYPLYIEVDAENVSAGNTPYNPPSGYDFVDLVDPVTVEGSVLEGYTFDTPVTGDQVVYTTPTSPDSVGFTVGADGEWILDYRPTEDQTISRYVIQANGTVGTEGNVTYQAATGGVLNSLLANAIISASGEVSITPSGTLSETLDDDTVNASGSSISAIVGTVTVTLEDESLGAIGTVAYSTITEADLDNIANAILDSEIENGETLRDVLRLLRAESVGKLTVVGNTISMRDAADTKDRVVATVDASGQRLNIITDGS